MEACSSKPWPLAYWSLPDGSTFPTMPALVEMLRRVLSTLSVEIGSCAKISALEKDWESLNPSAPSFTAFQFGPRRSWWPLQRCPCSCTLSPRCCRNRRETRTAWPSWSGTCFGLCASGWFRAWSLCRGTRRRGSGWARGSRRQICTRKINILGYRSWQRSVCT